MVYTKFMQHGIRGQKGQALVEAAVAIPIVVLLFAGCVQLLQIGAAHIIVLDAVFEAGRQAAMDGGNDNAQRVAGEICRTISAGATEFTADNFQYQVTHHLAAFFPIVKNVVISHACLRTCFDTSREHN
jgi:hypothetical protein